MKNLSLVSIASLGLILTACTPAKLIPLPEVAATNKSEIKINRVSAFNAKLVKAVFGEGEKDYVTISNGSEKVIYLPAGEYEFFVRSNQGDSPYKKKFILSHEQVLCLEIKPNSSNYAKAIVPLSYYLGHTFLINEKECDIVEP